MGVSSSLVRSRSVWAILVLCLLGTPAAAAVEVYPVNSVGRGVVGVGYTVVQGTQIEPFTVEVLGVMERAGPAGSLILVRALGDVIDRTGGIASGMSGSPVFIEGKLLGAIGYGFEMADHRIGLVTPASDMLQVMDLIQVEGEEEGVPQDSTESGAPALDDAEPQVELDPMRGGAEDQASGESLPSGIVLAGSPVEAEQLASLLPPGVWVARPVATPLVARGLGSRAMERLKKSFAGYNVFPVQAGGPPGGEEIPAVIAPGAAIGVQLVRGDVELTAIGTLTAVDGQRFIAFGHSLFNRGEVDHFVTGAYIHHTVPSVSFPFKIGAALAPIGSLLQDRGAAIAGVLGRNPKTVTLDVRVADRDRQVEKEFRAEIVQDKELTVPLIVVAALEAVDRSLDRIGAGTAWVRLRIDGEGMPRSLQRENVFYSSGDVAAAALSELLVAVDLLHENEFQDPRLRSVSVEIEVEEERKTARIERARPSVRKARPGERVDVAVTLRPYRSPAFEVTVPLEIPKGVSPGTVTVTVRGGAFGGEAPLPSDLSDDLVLAGEETGESSHLSIEAENLEKLIDEFEGEPKNNDVVVEFYPPSFFDAHGGFFEAAEESPSVSESSDADDAAAGPDGGGKEELSEGSDDDGDAEAGEPGESGEDGTVFGEESGEEAVSRAEGERRSDRPVRAVVPTGFVIHGEAQFTLTIEEGTARTKGAEDERPLVPAPPADPWTSPEVHPINAN